MVCADGAVVQAVLLSMRKALMILRASAKVANRCSVEALASDQLIRDRDELN
jgi:hypothetical protein